MAHVASTAKTRMETVSKSSITRRSRMPWLHGRLSALNVVGVTPRSALARLLPLLGLVAAGPLVAGCGPEPPSIRMLMYSPNAGFVGQELKVSGSVAYTDPDNDISQTVIEVADPANQ